MAVRAIDADTAAMSTTLRQGTYSTLNFYFPRDLVGSILGVCSMPSDISVISDPTNPNTPVDPKHMLTTATP